jgi:hypothetical protein
MGFGVAEVAGWQRLVASGVVGDSGKAIDVIGYTIKSGATAAQPSFLNGTGLTSPLAWADVALTVSAEGSKALAYPVRLAAGCFVSFDANTTAVTVFYRQMLST